MPILIALLVLTLIAGGIGAFLVTRDPSPVLVGNDDDAEAETSASCDPVEEMADLGGGHMTTSDEALTADSPQVIYPDRPPTSGRHVGQVLATGIYDVFVDDRLTTHNLEHGYVVVWHRLDTPPETVSALQDWATAATESGFPKLIVAPYYDVLPDGAQLAFTAWRQRRLCSAFDAVAADAFLAEHYDAEGVAPEAGIADHQAGQQGVLDPAGADLLFPPLDTLGVSSD